VFGILLIDKPEGWTSHDVCQKLKRVLSEPRIGHTGTLDPMATGLMVVCVGEATKFVKYLASDDKVYEAEITFGIATNTQDITGEVVAAGDPSHLTEGDIDAKTALFQGAIRQVPPAFSAVKIDGKKLYEYAHAGKSGPEAASREVFVHEFVRLDSLQTKPDGTKSARFRVHVSKGTYVRTLAHDLGIRLGVPATLSKLRRVSAGIHDVKNAVRWESIDKASPPFLDWKQALGLPSIIVDDDVKRLVSHGAMLPTALFPALEDTMLWDRLGHLLAVYQYDFTHNLMRVSVICHECPNP
jgi:tRNA pseudouridine55 synthase